MASWQLKNKRGPGGGLLSGTSTLNSTAASSSHANPSSGIHSSLQPPAQQQLHLTSHLDTGDDMVRQFAASQIDTQKTAFMRWVNVQLAKTTTYVPMATIERDLRDGKRLIGLLEVISKEPLKPERGNMRIHQMANVSKALSFLEKRTDEPLGSIGNEDIVDGNVKLTLGLIWIIIYRFQIQHVANTMTEIYPSLVEDIHQVKNFFLCVFFFFLGTSVFVRDSAMWSLLSVPLYLSTCLHRSPPGNIKEQRQCGCVIVGGGKGGADTVLVN